MRTQTLSLILLIAAAIALVLLSPSCGGKGGSSAGAGSSLYQGNGNLPGTTGTLGRGNITAADLPVPQQVQGGSSNAPLGTNPLYNVSQGGSVVTPVHSGSRVTSTLAQGQIFKLN